MKEIVSVLQEDNVELLKPIKDSIFEYETNTVLKVIESIVGMAAYFGAFKCFLYLESNGSSIINIDKCYLNFYILFYY